MSVYSVRLADERDPLLGLTLGVRAALDQFDALLDTYAPANRANTMEGSLDEGTACVLGAVAIALCLAEHLDRTSMPNVDANVVEGTDEWLR